MSSTIDQYRDAKSHYLKLRAEAKKDLLRRFQELANELLLIQRELLEDFGHKVTLPSKGKKPKKVAAPSEPAKAPAKSAAVSPKEAAIHKQLEKTRMKLAETQAAGKPTKPVEDRIYELEDELRLAQAK